jgi:hypothetical protein
MNPDFENLKPLLDFCEKAGVLEDGGLEFVLPPDRTKWMLDDSLHHVLVINLCDPNPKVLVETWHETGDEPDLCDELQMEGLTILKVTRIWQAQAEQLNKTYSRIREESD